jgi:hypothetical protein
MAPLESGLMASQPAELAEALQLEVAPISVKPTF